MGRGKEAVESVILGTGLSALAGATTGATVAVLKNAPVKQFATATGLNCGVFGATFFLVRETFLTYQQSKNPQFGLKDSQTRDIDELISSAMAGATTGGLLSAAYRGPKGAAPGAVMFGLICTGLQVAYTGANKWRQNRILESGDGKPVTRESILRHIHMPTWFPIHQISEEEYNDLLDTKLQTLEAEVAALEKQLKEMEKK
ncbi:hypothetical protein K501DRAFT_254110 [Backusella circina FSU 941]|nr:hypothetical protein K501DRAFT_254110 [Backusella circina FSU 941]